jgi:hypothetical protein
MLAGADQSTHKIYIWETTDGRFVTTLDGGREAQADVHVSVEGPTHIISGVFVLGCMIVSSDRAFFSGIRRNRALHRPASTATF